MPIKNGLNPTRVRTPEAGLSTWDFLSEVISSQRHRHPNDDAQALHDRFTAGEVVLRDQTPLKPGTVLGKDVDVFFHRLKERRPLGSKYRDEEGNPPAHRIELHHTAVPVCRRYGSAEGSLR